MMDEMRNCTKCGSSADFAIFRGADRIYACRGHAHDVMNTWEGQQHIITTEEADGIPEGTEFTRDWLEKYNDGHWFSQELGEMFVRLIYEDRGGHWFSNGLAYEGPEEKAAIMSMVFASLSSMMGKTLAVYLTAPGVTMEDPEMAAMMDRLLKGHCANAKEEAVAHSVYLERQLTGGGTLQ